MADLCVIPVRGVVRADGFSFDRVSKTSSGAPYFVWRSPGYWLRQKIYHRGRKEIKREYDKVLRETKRVKIREDQAAYYQQNQDRLKRKSRDYAPLWRLKYPAHSRALIARRRTRIAHATDATADKAIIREIYRSAARVQKCTGIPFHVDHITPISKGGRHHQENLQVITARLNRKKSNKIL